MIMKGLDVRSIRNLVAVCLIAMLAMSTNCDDDELEIAYTVEVENRCGEAVKAYWDVVYPGCPDIVDLGRFNFSSFRLSDGGRNEIDVPGSGKGTFRLVIVRVSTIREHGMEKIEQHCIYDELYELTNAELASCGYRIVYTGEENQGALQ